MKIGIGCSTYNRPKHLELWMEQTMRLTCSQAHQASNGGFIGSDFNHNTVYIYITDDSKDRKGIAYRKNECLRALKNCDYIFLFDDDTFPIKEGWAEFFIEASKASGQQHFMYLKETPTIKRLGTHIGEKDETRMVENMKVKFSYPVLEINEYNNCAGCFMFLTKEVIEKVGAYNPAYGFYGFEHAGYSNRIHLAGLTPMGKYLCPAGAGEYIYSMDLDFHRKEEFQNKVNHHPSMANEINNLPTYIALNKEVYLKDTEIYIPL